jgi:hypothetical protein
MDDEVVGPFTLVGPRVFICPHHLMKEACEAAKDKAYVFRSIED